MMKKEWPTFIDNFVKKMMSVNSNIYFWFIQIVNSLERYPREKISLIWIESLCPNFFLCLLSPLKEYRPPNKDIQNISRVQNFPRQLENDNFSSKL